MTAYDMTRLTTITAYYDQVGILSGGFTYFARRLQAEMGIDYVFANELDFVDGKLTGKVKGEIVDGERKALLLQQIAAENGLSLKQVGHCLIVIIRCCGQWGQRHPYAQARGRS